MKSPENEIKEIQFMRLEFIQSAKRNNQDIFPIIEQMFSNDEHFLLELLQNAEDEKAQNVSIHLNSEQIVFKHDSSNLFSLKDIDSITGTGKSTKKGKEGAIGKFGVGFKSIFKITDRPEIYSGNYQFAIENFIVPIWIDNQISVCRNKTITIAPLKENRKDILFQSLANSLKTLNTQNLLFLRNIESISIKIDAIINEESVEFIIDKRMHKQSEMSNNILAQVIKLDSSLLDHSETYLKFSKMLDIEGRVLPIDLVFGTEESEVPWPTNLKPISNPTIFVFLETNLRSTLHFLVNAPFETTSNRQDIPESDINSKIEEYLVAFYQEVLELLIELKLWNENTIELLPIEYDYYSISLYKKLYEKTIEIFKTKEIIPTSTNLLYSCKEVVIGDWRCIELFDVKDLGLLLNKKAWAKDSLRTKTKAFLKDKIGVQSTKFQDVMSRNLTPEFIASKTDKWLVQFYKHVKEIPSLWNRSDYTADRTFLNKPFIRTNENNHVLPDPLQVFISTYSTQPSSVKFELLKDESTRALMVGLGLKELDLYAKVLTQILPKYRDNNKVELEEHLLDFKAIIEVFLSADDMRRYRLISVIRELLIIYTSVGYISSCDTYIRYSDISIIIVNENLLVSDKYYKLGYDISTINEILRMLGCNDRFKVNVVERGKEYLDDWYGNGGNYDILLDRYCDRVSKNISDYELADIDLESLNFEQSLAFWTILCKNFNYYKNYLYIKYEVSPRIQRFDLPAFCSNFLSDLANMNWLYKSEFDNDAFNAETITKSSLETRYLNIAGNKDVINLLGLRDEESPESKIKSLEAELKQEREEKAELKKQLQELNSKTTKQEKIFKEISKTELFELDVEVLEYAKPKREQAMDNEEPISNPVAYKNTNLERIKIDSKHAEELVVSFLKEKHPNLSIEYCNINDSEQVGYDIIVKNALGEPTEYIEVKSTHASKPDAITLSGVQLSTAKEFKELFSLYIVLVSDKVRIIPVQNFYEKFLDGVIEVSKIEIKI